MKKFKSNFILVLSVSIIATLFFGCGSDTSDKSQKEDMAQIEEKIAKTESEMQQMAEPEIETEPEASEEPAQEAEQMEEEALTMDAPDPTESKLEALNVKLPKPMFIGTPQNIRVPNLEKPLGKPRPPFLAPAGTKNVAANKPVMSSDDMPIIGEIEMITDGDKEAADGSYVELGPFLQHITIDLGTTHDIYAVLFWHFHKQPTVYFDVIVQVSDDPDFKTGVKTIFNNDHDNSAGLGKGDDMHYVETSEGKLADAKGVQGRYVRLYSNGNSTNDLNHYIEVEVYGKPS